MGKKEVRELLLNGSVTAGDSTRERNEIEKILHSTDPSDMSTWTVGCSALLTVMCCE